MMRLGDFIKLAEVYGEDAEVYIEISENAKLHFRETDAEEVEELNGCTLTRFKDIKTFNDKDGIVLHLPIYQKYVRR